MVAVIFKAHGLLIELGEPVVSKARKAHKTAHGRVRLRGSRHFSREETSRFDASSRREIA